MKKILRITSGRKTKRSSDPADPWQMYVIKCVDEFSEVYDLVYFQRPTSIKIKAGCIYEGSLGRKKPGQNQAFNIDFQWTDWESKSGERIVPEEPMNPFEDPTIAETNIIDEIRKKELSIELLSIMKDSAVLMQGKGVDAMKLATDTLWEYYRKKIKTVLAEESEEKEKEEKL
jgi:hypothetical protein